MSDRRIAMHGSVPAAAQMRAVAGALEGMTRAEAAGLAGMEHQAVGVSAWTLADLRRGWRRAGAFAATKATCPS